MDFPKNMNFEQTSLNKLKILASVGQYVIGQALSQGEEWEKVGLTDKKISTEKTHALAWVFLFGSA